MLLSCSLLSILKIMLAQSNHGQKTIRELMRAVIPDSDPPTTMMITEELILNMQCIIRFQMSCIFQHCLNSKNPKHDQHLLFFFIAYSTANFTALCSYVFLWNQHLSIIRIPKAWVCVEDSVHEDSHVDRFCIAFICMKNRRSQITHP